MKAYQYCIYAILSSTDLASAYKNGGSGNFTDGRRWAMACDLFVDAEQRGQKLPIVFAEAADTSELIYHALVDRLDIHHTDRDHATTTCWFTDLEPFEAPRPNKTSLIVKDTDQNIPEQDKMPYVICITPTFMF